MKIKDNKEYYWFDEFGGINGPDPWPRLQELWLQSIISDETEICAVGDKTWVAYKATLSSSKSNSEFENQLKTDETYAIGNLEKTRTPEFKFVPSPSSPKKVPTPTLTPCPYCGEKILSAAKKCKHCKEFLDVSMRTQSQNKQSRSMVKPLFLAFVCAAAACTTGYMVLTKVNETARRQTEQQAKQEYQWQLTRTADEINEATARCIAICIIYSEQWQKGIEYGQMNRRLSAQAAQFNKNGANEKIQFYKSKIDQQMSDLASPPDAMKDIHRTLVELYGIYSQIYAHAISPSGTLLSYNNSINDLQSTYLRVVNELKVTLPK